MGNDWQDADAGGADLEVDVDAETTADVLAVPPSVRGWFVVDFVLSTFVTGLPLLIVPELLLRRLGWTEIDPVASRLTGAALVAIGWQSWRSRKSGHAAFRALLGLKVIWCSMGIVGLVAAIGAGGPQPTWALLAAFLVLDGVWIHYAIRLKRFEEAAGVKSRSEVVRPTDRAEDVDEDTATEDLGPIHRRRASRMSPRGLSQV